MRAALLERPTSPIKWSRLPADSRAQVHRTSPGASSGVLPARFTQPDAIAKYNRRGLLAARARGSNPNHDHRSPIQIDISFCPQQNAGNISHPGILLARGVIRDQDPGNRCGAYRDRSALSHHSPRCRPVGCGGGPSATRALGRAAGWLSSTSAVGRARARRPAGRCCPARW
jgi:hypothetical protein